MSQLIFIAHIPLMRMERQDDFPIGSGCLTKLPWEQFDGLTQGAFTDWRPKYERTDPVFFWHQQDMDLAFVREGSVDGMDEMKLPPVSWNEMLPKVGHQLLLAFHDQLVDPVWAAIALAAPAGIPAAPRNSVTFYLPAGNAHFEIGTMSMSGARIQGNFDQELVYLPDATFKPLSDSDLHRAAALVAVAQAALINSDIGPVLRQLLDTGDVTLAPSERLMLAVSAIENLVLPDVTTENGAVFARRLSNLIGLDDTHRATLIAVARDLYRQRSAVIHKRIMKAQQSVLVPAVAEQLLAGAIESMTIGVASSLKIDAIRHQLDKEVIGAPPAQALPIADPPGLGQDYRLGPRKAWNAGTFSSTGSLSSPEGTIVSWSPLVGLTYTGDIVSHSDLATNLTSMQSAAVVGMEEKDIRRDFITNVSLSGNVAALAVVAQHSGSMVDEERVLPLTRQRDLAVVGLRLAKFRAFIDPELLGWYVYDGRLRYRRETVLRQSVIMQINSTQHTAIGENDLDELNAIWSLLSRYQEHARDDEVDRILDLYRRVHDRFFLPTPTRAVLAGICLEATLGRFSKPTARMQLESIVASLNGVDSEAVEWFRAEGRTFRNESAHGKWAPEQIGMPEIWQTDHLPISNLLEITRAAVRNMLEIWVNSDPPVRARHGAARLLRRALRKKIM